MDGSGASGGKVFGRFTEPTHQVLGLARAEAAWPGPRWLAWSIGAYVPAPRPRDSELLGSLGIDFPPVGSLPAAAARPRVPGTEPTSSRGSQHGGCRSAGPASRSSASRTQRSSGWPAKRCSSR